MDIVDILKQQSLWTWNVMESCSHLGEMIREDALTSVNLAAIYELAKNNDVPLDIMSCQGAHLEAETGADWTWSIGQTRYLVQAKRLDVVQELNMLSYSINIQQLEKLIQYANLLTQNGTNTTPVYVFYNSLISDVPPNKRIDVGCTFLNAIDLRNYLRVQEKLNQKTTEVLFSQTVESLNAKSWYTMFS